jgi:NAD synthase
MDFLSAYAHGFVRVAACTPAVSVADPAANADAIVSLATRADDAGAVVTLFPELSVSAYAIDDLLQQDVVLEACMTALRKIMAVSRAVRGLLVVGAPLRKDGRLYNCAMVVHKGRVLGVVPKSYLPNYREYYERRHFASGAGIRGESIEVYGDKVPFGVDLLFECTDIPGLVTGIEICEDLWTPLPPSTSAALAGATLLLNLSASNITIGKADVRRQLCRSQSASCIAAYAYSAAGLGESTTDLSWDGQAMIYENGARLAESERFAREPGLIVADVDLERIRQERTRTVTFNDCREAQDLPPYRRVTYGQEIPKGDIGFRRVVERFPFVPSDPARLDEDCYEAYNIQVHALAQRLTSSGIRKVVIGVSGGLDSTQALLVAARAFDLLGWPRTDILGFTLPGFATGERTRGNAWRLMEALGITGEEIDITGAAGAMLERMGHPFAAGEKVYDVTFENVQAGLRTDYLFRLANQRGGLVLGTGDFSELALGWCTYGVGDHMSHYNVNAGVSKTLMQYLIRWVAARGVFDEGVGTVLLDILGTEISPELVPPGADGEIQSTQDRIGPYELQDFNAHYIVRYGFRPSKVAFLAYQAWRDAGDGPWPAGFPDALKTAYDIAEIRKWLRVFLQRFFGFSQFKRSAVPNGPKVSSGGSLSPRGDWRAPSDSSAAPWLEELDRNVPESL